jgi:hypothetical protein
MFDSQVAATFGSMPCKMAKSISLSGRAVPFARLPNEIDPADQGFACCPGGDSGTDLLDGHFKRLLVNAL